LEFRIFDLKETLINIQPAQQRKMKVLRHQCIAHVVIGTSAEDTKEKT
jgi:hypothetical protein